MVRVARMHFWRSHTYKDACMLQKCEYLVALEMLTTKEYI